MKSGACGGEASPAILPFLAVRRREAKERRWAPIQSWSSISMGLCCAGRPCRLFSERRLSGDQLALLVMHGPLGQNPLVQPPLNTRPTRNPAA